MHEVTGYLTDRYCPGTHRRCRLRSCRASASAAAAISSLLPVVTAAAAGLGCLAVAVDSRRASREACAGMGMWSGWGQA